MVHEKTPVPDPEVHEELAVVGFGDVLQHIPRVVTVAEPWFVTLPFPVALLVVIPVTELVVTLGGEEDKVVNVTCDP
jgi:hypothetical protein